ncbi:MAG: DUF4330 domain-containing protein [Candidatus Omnitrophica bacterium]|nr:DUF4330 domain-containing protein [Candidatus Omnitrophota bacterium]
MRLIDKEGRLFGKLNVVDFFIIALLIVVIPGFLGMYKILGKRPTWVPSQWVRVKAVTFTIPEIADLLKPGDISYDRFGNTQARLLSVSERDSDYANDLKSAVKSTSMTEYEHRMGLILELELLCTKSAENEPFYYMRVPIFASLDEPHEFSSKKYSVKFYVLDIKP